MRRSQECLIAAVLLVLSAAVAAAPPEQPEKPQPEWQVKLKSAKPQERIEGVKQAFLAADIGQPQRNEAVRSLAETALADSDEAVRGLFDTVLVGPMGGLSHTHDLDVPTCRVLSVWSAARLSRVSDPELRTKLVGYVSEFAQHNPGVAYPAMIAASGAAEPTVRIEALKHLGWLSHKCGSSWPGLSVAPLMRSFADPHLAVSAAAGQSLSVLARQHGPWRSTIAEFACRVLADPQPRHGAADWEWAGCWLESMGPEAHAVLPTLRKLSAELAQSGTRNHRAHVLNAMLAARADPAELTLTEWEVLLAEFPCPRMADPAEAWQRFRAADPAAAAAADRPCNEMFRVTWWAVEGDLSPNQLEDAVWALGQLGPGAKRAVPMLEGLLRSKEQDRCVTARCFESLWRITGRVPKVEPWKLISWRDKFVAVEIGQPLVDLYLANLEDPEPLNRGAAVYGLARLKVRAAIPLLVKRLNDKDWSVTREAIRGLASFGKDARPAVPRLAKLLDTDAYDDVFSTLISIGTNEARLALTEATRQNVNEQHWGIVSRIGDTDFCHLGPNHRGLWIAAKEKKVNLWTRWCGPPDIAGYLYIEGLIHTPHPALILRDIYTRQGEISIAQLSANCWTVGLRSLFERESWIRPEPVSLRFVPDDRLERVLRLPLVWSWLLQHHPDWQRANHTGFARTVAELNDASPLTRWRAALRLLADEDSPDPVPSIHGSMSFELPRFLRAELAARLDHPDFVVRVAAAWTILRGNFNYARERLGLEYRYDIHDLRALSLLPGLLLPDVDSRSGSSPIGTPVLSAEESRRLIPAILALLESDEEARRVRGCLYVVLTARHWPEEPRRRALLRLRQLDGVPRVRCAMAYAVWALDGRVEPVLPDLMCYTSEMVGLFASRRSDDWFLENAPLLVRVGPKPEAMVPWLNLGLRSANTDELSWTLRVLAELGEVGPIPRAAARTALPVIRRRLRHEDCRIRLAAVWALQVLTDPSEWTPEASAEVVSCIRPILVYHDERVFSVRSFAGLPAEAELPLLRELLSSAFRANRLAAARRLGELAAPETLSDLVDRLDDADYEVRRACVAALPRFGPAAVVALPRLREIALDDLDTELVRLALRAIAQLTVDAP